MSRNQRIRLLLETATPPEVRQYVQELHSKINGLRLANKRLRAGLAPKRSEAPHKFANLKNETKV